MSAKTRKINRPPIRIEPIAGPNVEAVSQQAAGGVRGGYLSYQLADCMVSSFRAPSPKVNGDGITATDTCGQWPV